MNRRWSLNKKNNKIVYNLININENTKDKECINADTENEKKYQSVMKKAGKTSKIWDNTGVTMNIDVPSPPKPNNYDRLLDYKKKNVLRPSIQQSKATLYLFKKGYKLGKDYEAYQAIEIHKKLTKIEQEENNFNELLEDNQNNIPDKLKDLSLVEKIPKKKNMIGISEKRNNIYPNLNKNVISNGWKPNFFKQPFVEHPEPSAPPAPNLFDEGIAKFKNIEKRYNSTSSDEYNIDC